MKHELNLYIQHSESDVSIYSVTGHDPLSGEVTKAISATHSPLVLVASGDKDASTLDDLFLLMQQLYRPLMRKRGCQFWVYWEAKGCTTLQKGAQALCQISAMELAGKKARINFLHGDQSFTQEDYMKLTELAGVEYLTAQSLNWVQTLESSL
ncbi:hypothetical protein [Vibrio mexicanus]|uniref:hypothetical protein n=1 Tax=Vibrio mexicanus TaxID=1004326 RepID=UPI00063CD450|nr:hypothetical protein [Vibrio mexicanus]